jgi:hypothetical protein
MDRFSLYVAKQGAASQQDFDMIVQRCLVGMGDDSFVNEGACHAVSPIQDGQRIRGVQSDRQLAQECGFIINIFIK